ncbi:nucleotidyltransferase family protein [Vreelandella sp. GE22]
MTNEARLIAWLGQDRLRMQALRVAAGFGLSQWCLAAGFVRNLAWDKAHGFDNATPLNDIDLIYFDPQDTRPETDRALELELNRRMALPWSVKNQARMHTRNADAPYGSCEDAMRHWVEVETAVGALLDERGRIRLVAPFGVAALFELTITLNPARPKLVAFQARLAEKGWLRQWPGLTVKGLPVSPDARDA